MKDDPLYVSTLRRATYDASGSFSFPRVPDGVWCVTTNVKWGGPNNSVEGSIEDETDGRAGREAVKVVLP